MCKSHRSSCFAHPGTTCMNLCANATVENDYSKKSPPKRAFELQFVRVWRSGGLGVDLGEVVLGSLGTVGDELAEIFGGGFGSRHEHFAACTNHIGLDLNRFVERLGGRQLVDASEERFGILVDRLLDRAADLGGFADRTGNSG